MLKGELTLQKLTASTPMHADYIDLTSFSAE